MVYAGNGSLLAAFERKADMDRFLAAHCSWGRERAEQAREYPQYRRALFSARMGGMVEAVNVHGETDFFWTRRINEAIA